MQYNILYTFPLSLESALKFLIVKAYESSFLGLWITGAGCMNSEEQLNTNTHC